MSATIARWQTELSTWGQGQAALIRIPRPDIDMDNTDDTPAYDLVWVHAGTGVCRADIRIDPLYHRLDGLDEYDRQRARELLATAPPEAQFVAEYIP